MKILTLCLLFAIPTFANEMFYSELIKLKSIPPEIDFLQYQNEIVRWTGADDQKEGTNASFETNGVQGAVEDFNDYRMWGWSRDGKVAYTNVISHVNRGTYTIQAIIFDFVQDKIVWQAYLNTFDSPSDAEYSEFFPKFLEACKNIGITPAKFDFKRLPIKHKGKTFNVLIEIIEKDDDAILNYRVVIANNSKQKIISEKRDTNYIQGFGVQAAVVLGYFISPYEDRVLIVLGQARYWFEGYDVTYYLIGAHL